MELLILLIGLGIFAETTFLTVSSVSKKNTKTRGHRLIYVDTSALIDGRILEVAKTGFVSDDFIIPRSVIRELQLLADGKDSIKRSRARDGLDTVNELERVTYFNTEIVDDSELGRMLVDERLIKLAKENKGVILTCDYNLEKVAKTEKVEVLNINDLSMALTNKYRPGDRLQVRITEKGQNQGQGVGHLADGTMVVVDNAENLVGQEITVNFIRFLQTSAGRMIFADVAFVPKKPRLPSKTTQGRKKPGLQR